jgi:hypothetical protein
MKMHRISIAASAISLTIQLLSCASFVSTAAGQTSADFPAVVPFDLGAAEFFPGDNITIQRVTGTSPTISTGGTYCVEGTYTLASRDKADLSLYITTVTNISTPTDPSQIMRIEKGTGTFRLVTTMGSEGYLHVSFYPVSTGSSFGGIYFGQGAWVLRNKTWSDLESRDETQPAGASGNANTAPLSVTEPNQALYEYLGNPVEPPANMNPAYGKAGLINAVQTAAGNAGVTVKRIEVDDSEFPCVVGVICGESDYEKLKEQFRKLAPYDYGGSVGSHACHAFNLVPYRAFPPAASQRIHHRLTVRMQMFYDKVSALP